MLFASGGKGGHRYGSIPTPLYKKSYFIQNLQTADAQHIYIALNLNFIYNIFVKYASLSGAFFEKTKIYMAADRSAAL